MSNKLCPDCQITYHCPRCKQEVDEEDFDYSLGVCDKCAEELNKKDEKNYGN